MLVCVLSVGFAVRGAAAPEDEFPVAIIDRPTTLPPGYLRLDFALSLAREPRTRSGVRVGAGYGLLESLELGLVFLDFDFLPASRFANLSAYARYGMALRPVVSLAPFARVFLPLADPLTLQTGAEAAALLAHRFQALGTPSLSYTFGAAPTATLAVPLSLKARLSDRLQLSLLFGVIVTRSMDREATGAKDLLAFDEAVGELGLTATTTLGSAPGVTADLGLSWLWPRLVGFRGARDGPGDWQLVLSIDLHRRIHRPAANP